MHAGATVCLRLSEHSGHRAEQPGRPTQCMAEPHALVDRQVCPDEGIVILLALLAAAKLCLTRNTCSAAPPATPSSCLQEPRGAGVPEGRPKPNAGVGPQGWGEPPEAPSGCVSARLDRRLPLAGRPCHVERALPQPLPAPDDEPARCHRLLRVRIVNAAAASGVPDVNT